MQKTTDVAHLLIKNHIKEDSFVIDATCGNGHDTYFLASIVNKGVVYAYDIQLEAINNSKSLNSCFNNIKYFNTSFENIKAKNCDLVLFNLGYLPKCNKDIKTTKDVTINAINNLINQFNDNLNMLILIVMYPGHSEGLIESNAICDLLNSLDSKVYYTSIFKPINQKNAPFIGIITLKH